MQHRNIARLIGTSRLAFPLVAVVSLLLWLIGKGLVVSGSRAITVEVFQDFPVWVSDVSGVVLGVLVVFLLIELNNAHSLLEHRSTLHTTFFLLLWCVVPQVVHSVPVSGVLFAFLLAFYTLFHCSQRGNSAGGVFFAFLCIGLSSLLYPRLLFLILPFYVALFLFNTLTFRLFWAGVMGVLLPGWFLFVYSFCFDDLELFHRISGELVAFGPMSHSVLTPEERCVWGYVALLFAVGAVYFLFTRSHDKLRIQAYYHFLIWFGLCCLLLFTLQPFYGEVLLPLTIVSTSLLAGRMFTLMSAKSGNIFLGVLFVLWILMSIFTVWMPLHKSF